MTTVPMTGPKAHDTQLIHAAILRHGAMRVLLAALHAMVKVRPVRREHPPDVSLLDARMRQDIGLLPQIDRMDHRLML